MKRLHRLKGFVVVLVCVLLMATSASANHYVYMGMDPSKQLGDAGTENLVDYWWALTYASIYWSADASLQSDASTAVSNWNTAVGMPWYNSGPSSADVTIQVDTSIPGYGQHSVVAIYTDSTRNANYTLTSAIKVNNTLNPQGGIAATITHELGHMIGLHERYKDSSSTNNVDSFGCSTESTIMDSGDCAQRPSTPSSLDISRVNGIYKTGELKNWTAAGGSGAITFTWNDYAWGELAHQLYLYRWDGSQWINLGSVDHTQDIGLHADYSVRTLSHTFYRSTYGAAAGYFLVCGWTTHEWGGSSGSGSGRGVWSCSPWAYVS